MLRGSWDSREATCVQWRVHQREGERTYRASEGLSRDFGFPSECGRVCQNFQCMRVLDGSLFLPTGLRLMISTTCLEPQESVNEEIEAQRVSSTCQRSHRRQKIDLALCCPAGTLLPRNLLRGTKELWPACPLLVPQVSPVRLLVLI